VGIVERRVIGRERYRECHRSSGGDGAPRCDGLLNNGLLSARRVLPNGAEHPQRLIIVDRYA
jgi:hypothetical protein